MEQGVRENINVLNDAQKRGDQTFVLKNSQNTIVKRLLIAAFIFAILTLLPLAGWEPDFDAAAALSIVSFWLCITSLLVAWIFHNRFKKLQTLMSGESLLAAWTLTPFMKENYTNYRFSQEKEKNAAVFTVVFVISTVIFGLFILFMDEGKLFMLGIFGTLILFLSLFAFGMPYYYRYTNQKGDGKILIGAKYAYINGYFHNWDFPLSGLSKVKIMKKPFYGIDLIYYYTDRTLQHSEELFIPANEDMELESLVQSLRELNQRRGRRKK